MNITVKNLGPITAGSVAFDKALTILTGPNNMGKSYITYLIYGITKFNALADEFQLEQELIKLFSRSSFLKKNLEKDSCIDLEELINYHLVQIGKIVNKTIQESLVQIFASKSIKAEINLEMNSVNLNYGEEDYQKIKVVEGVPFAIRKNGHTDKEAFESDFKSTMSTLSKVARCAAYVLSYDLTVTDVFGRATFFPAERTAINLFARHLVSTKANFTDKLDAQLTAGVPSAKIARLLTKQAQQKPRYPYAVNEYINFVNNFTIRGGEGQFARIANNLDKLVAGGEIALSEFNQVFFTPAGSKEPLNLHLSSSLIKSLSYISLYLRYVAEVNDLVIVDEPELNLHPNLQVAIAKIIAEMVNAGLKVIISTHSDYLIKELNNLVLLHQLRHSAENTAFVRENDYQPEHLLNPTQVSAYFLDERTIKRISIEANGIEVPSINDTIEKLDYIAEELFIKIEAQS